MSNATNTGADALTLGMGDTEQEWTKMPFIMNVENATDFKDVTAMLKYSLGEQDSGTDTQMSSINAAMGNMVAAHNTIDDGSGSSDFTKRPFLADTRLGWNDAVNVLWQFNRDDDIIHAINESEDGHGMGRVYTNLIQKHQVILWLSFGVPEFSGMWDFYKHSIDTKLANAVRNGSGDFIRGIGATITQTGITVLKLPFMPFVWLKDLIGAAGGNQTITRYYDFKTAMPMYYQTVTSILSTLAVNLGFAGSPLAEGASADSVPFLLQRTDGDIYKILTQRAAYKLGDNSGVKSSYDLLQEKNETDMALRTAEKEKKRSSDGTGAAITSFGDTFLSSARESMFGALSFVGFRIEKSASSSESFSNNTGESKLAQQINSQIAAARDSSFSMQGGSTGIGPLDGLIDFGKGLVDGAAAAIGGPAEAFLNTYSGAGYIDIPEVWTNSSFGKSYDFEIQLRAPYGDPISVYQSCLVPYSMWLAAVLPRAVGRHSYTSPFICRGYCKGRSAFPLAMVGSLNAVRGASEFGWNIDHLPTQIDLTINIKDLSPAMYSSMAGGLGDQLAAIFSQNSSFQEYLMTLSGMGLAERMLFFKNIKRKFEVFLQTARNTYGNPLYWGNRIGDSGILRTVAAFYPHSAIPEIK